MTISKAPSRPDALFARLESEIRSGRYEPGDRLPTEKDIAEQNGVSRTVVREAVSRLVAQGLAEARQGSGLFVSKMARYPAFQVAPAELGHLDEIIKLLELRMAVEAEMASLAAIRRSSADLAILRSCLAAVEASENSEEAVKADVAFHQAIARAARNDYFERFIDFLGIRLVPSRELMLSGQPVDTHLVYARTIAAEHREIFDAIMDQDPVRARSAARRHMQISLERHAALASHQGPTRAA